MEALEYLKPQELVKKLDKYIVGQKEAKKAVAIALRNRYRRKMVEESLRDEIIPKNILMVGPTGVGKTEIARRIAKLTDAPFIKVEATNFTEVGYVGKDVESIIKDLLDNSIKKERKKEQKNSETKAKEMAKNKIIDIILKTFAGTDAEKEKEKESLTQLFDEGKLNETEIEIEVQEQSRPVIEQIDLTNEEVHMGMVGFGEIIGKVFNGKKKKEKMNVADAFEIFVEDFEDDLIDEEKIIKISIKKVEEDGIVFIDEIDKVSMHDKSAIKGFDVSREGVQRDLLPLIEGTTVSTRYGQIKTDHILFIASGAFHNSNVSDLLPEFQGRFPIRVQLNKLEVSDFIKIMTEPDTSLTKQYSALMKVEDINLSFSKDGIEEIARLVFKMNEEIENIGARRLHTLIEKIIEDLSFEATEMKKGTKVKIDKKYVNNHIGELIIKTDLEKFIL
jgi:ATP-dependent HslUV protease ATP-binding subunit HslU